MVKKRTAKDLRCMECGLACPCDLYPNKEPHAHCPGGLDDWLLCESCEKKCLAIHRPVDKAGKWKWINDCGNPKCGYCLALAKLRGSLAHPPARKAKKTTKKKRKT